MPARHFTIIGDVQGVGYRYAMVCEARRLRLAGWVRNRADGSVEAVAVGAHGALDELADALHRHIDCESLLAIARGERC